MTAAATRRARVLVHGERSGDLERIDGLLGEVGAEGIEAASAPELARLLEEDAVDLGMEGRDELPGLDSVLLTASDRPLDDSLPALVDPAADRLEGEVALRRADVDAKHRRVVEFLDARPATAGADPFIPGR